MQYNEITQTDFYHVGDQHVFVFAGIMLSKGLKTHPMKVGETVFVCTKEE